MPEIPALGKWKQENEKFKVIFDYVIKATWNTETIQKGRGGMREGQTEKPTDREGGWEGKDKEKWKS